MRFRADLELLANIRLQTKWTIGSDGKLKRTKFGLKTLQGWFYSLVYYRAVRLFGWRHV